MSMWSCSVLMQPCLKTTPRMLCLARYTTQPAFGSSYESLVSLYFSLLRCHITGNLFQHANAGQRRGHAPLRHLGHSGACGGLAWHGKSVWRESCPMLMYAYGMVLVSRWLLPDKSSSNGVHSWHIIFWRWIGFFRRAGLFFCFSEHSM